jgi:NAD(P)-dependent dehydrogenase (short-subunit alcohol dehydrogenase family)
MVTKKDVPILIDLHQRIRLALRSPDATEAPRALRRILWTAAGMLYRMLVAPARRAPKPKEIRDAIAFLTQALDAWLTWLCSPERMEAISGQ